MARRPRGMKRAKFKVSGLRDTLLQCSDMLYKAISKQNPDVDQDDVEDALRALVRQLGGSTAPADSGDGAEATASLDDKPAYNLAGDILVIAAEHFGNGDFKNAFKLFSTAMEADGCSELIAGIKEMNSDTTVAEIAASMTDDEDGDVDADDADDFGGDEDDAMDEVVSELEDLDDSGVDDIDDEDGDAFEADPVMDDEDDCDLETDASFEEDDEEEIDDDEEAQPGVPMGGVSTKAGMSAAALRALANKASSDGSESSRAKALKLLKR